MSETIWASPELRRRWEQMISKRAVGYVTRFINANPEPEFKTLQEHGEQTGIKIGHIRRALRALDELGLLAVTERNETWRVRFSIPIRAEPPAAYHKAIWMRDPTKRKHTPEAVKEAIYDLDGGVCTYCEKRLTYAESKLDHIYPVSAGGADAAANQTITCESCNRTKWSRIPGDSEFLYPKRFRGRRVASVMFEGQPPMISPVFVLEGDDV